MTRTMGRGLSSQAVVAHRGLRTAKGAVVVIEVTQFGIYEALDIEEGFLAISKGMTSAATVQTRTFAIVISAASMLRDT